MRGQAGHRTRREFLRAAAAAAAPYFLTSTALGAEGRAPASDRIAMGAIGIGGRGGGNMRGFTHRREVQMLAVCDVVEGKRLGAKKAVDTHQRNNDCTAYNDFRDLMDRSDIDAVSIATPDHWHGLVAIAACKSGKDVFCEKPLSLTVRGGRAMVEAARRYGRVFSSGSQRVLGDYGGLARSIRSGGIGEVREAFVGVGGPSKACYLPPQPVPKGLDWDLWLGPAPWAPFNRGRLNFRPWRDYSGGQMTDWGGHKFGAVIFAMDLQETSPVEIVPPDGKDFKHLTYIYANGFHMYHARPRRHLRRHRRPGLPPRPQGRAPPGRVGQRAHDDLQGQRRHPGRLPPLRPHAPAALPRRRVRPPRRHGLPPRQHRLLAQAPAPLRPRRRADPRRPRGRPLARQAATRAVEALKWVSGWVDDWMIGSAEAALVSCVLSSPASIHPSTHPIIHPPAPAGPRQVTGHERPQAY